jgi:predicted phage terminase large subunit-like protein
VDELTQFPPYVLYMLSRMRRLKGSIVPTRFRAATNPGGVGHEWVKERYITPPHHPDRVFVPATMRDNPYLDIADYRQSLESMGDPILQQQLEEGDWDVMAGGMLFRSADWFKIVDLVPGEVKDQVLMWDLAGTAPEYGKDPDFTAGAWWVYTDFGYFLHEMWSMQGTPYEVETFIQEKSAEFGRYDPIYIEQEPGQSGVSQIDYYKRHVLRGYRVFEYKPTKNKVKRAGPLASAAQSGYVGMRRAPWNKPFTTQALLFPTKGVHDDYVDAASAGYLMLSEGKTKIAGVTVNRATESVARRTGSGIVIPGVSATMNREYTRYSTVYHSWGRNGRTGVPVRSGKGFRRGSEDRYESTA